MMDLEKEKSERRSAAQPRPIPSFNDAGERLHPQAECRSTEGGIPARLTPLRLNTAARCAQLLNRPRELALQLLITAHPTGKPARPAPAKHTLVNHPTRRVRVPQVGM